MSGKRLFGLVLVVVMILNSSGKVKAECHKKDDIRCGQEGAYPCSSDPNCTGKCVTSGCKNGRQNWCVYDKCYDQNFCSGDKWVCDPCSDKPSVCGNGDCFTPDTLIGTSGGQAAIINLEEGESVASFNPETDSESSSLIEKTFEFTRNAYYRICTKGGHEVNVTGTHPFFAVKKEAIPLSFWEYLKKESLTRKLFDKLLK